MVIGQKAPNFQVSEWVQGAPTNFDQEADHIVLLEVFQVNCPGCFMHALPEAINIYNKYASDGVRVLGLATAFEDFGKNTLDNLKLLAETGKVIGETQAALSMHNQLVDGDKLSYKIPFPLGMDKLTKTANGDATTPDGGISRQTIMQYIHPQVPDFDSRPKEYQEAMIKRVIAYIRSKEYSAGTFEMFALQGTPSTILVDRNGMLRNVSFGQAGHIDAMIQKLLNED